MAKDGKRSTASTPEETTLPPEWSEQLRKAKTLVTSMQIPSDMWARMQTEAIERAKARAVIDRPQVVVVESRRAAPPQPNPAAEPLHPHRWLEDEVDRMKANGETRDRFKSDIARAIAPRMKQAAKRGEVARALSVGRIKNLLTDLKLL